LLLQKNSVVATSAHPGLPEGDGPEWGFNNFDAFGREQIHHVYQDENDWSKEHLFRPDYIIVH
jgi:hypothetical protein